MRNTLLGVAVLLILGGATESASSAHTVPAPSAPASSALASPAPSPAKSVPPSGRASRPVKPAHGDGPAGSLMRTGTSSVALTFDDGPDPVQTPAILDLLAKNRVKATFCVVGTRVRKHPDLVRRIAKDGHTLCNHSWNHNLTLGKGKRAAVRADLAKTNAAIRAAVPGARIAYFRAPGGNFTGAMATVAADLGMRSIYWHVDPRDWDHTTDASDGKHCGRVVDAVEHGVRKGSIVLSHDYEQPQTVEAYKTLLPWLKKRYRLVALP